VMTGHATVMTTSSRLRPWIALPVSVYVLVMLNVADLGTTLVGLGLFADRLHEQNPLIVAALTLGGLPALVVLKSAAVITIVASVIHLHRRFAGAEMRRRTGIVIRGSIVLYLVVVVNNLSLFATMNTATDVLPTPCPACHVASASTGDPVIASR
jgi:hypothetical protein